MKEHEKINELLPFFITGNLTDQEKKQVQDHLQLCTECNEELALWEDISRVVQSENQNLNKSQSVLTHTLETIRENENPGNLIRKTWQILVTQIPLVHKEIWPASFLILILGFAVTLIVDRVAFIYALAPLVSAAGLAFIYGGEHDPAHELVLTTPVSQIQILLSRSILVFGYNILIMLILTWALSFFYSGNIVLPLIMEWLAPMTFLSSLGLCLSILSNSENAIFLSYFLWLSKYLLFLPEWNSTFKQIGNNYLAFWQNPVVLYTLSLILVTVLLVYTRISSGKIQRLT